MVDPFAEVVALLQPGAPFSKRVFAAGSWSVRREEFGRPFYCVILEGSCTLSVDDREPVALDAGDFVLIPSAYNFTMSGGESTTAQPIEPSVIDGQVRLGRQDGPPEVRLLIGHCVFGSPDAGLLVSLLPQFAHIRGDHRLATLVQLVGDESREQRPARDVVMARLLEVLLIEALRSTANTTTSPGLLRGLGDVRLANAIRRMHERPTEAWTIARLAAEAALSRSAFFDRFSRAVGMAPMAYLLAWRMALAKNLLRRAEGGVAEIAERVGYSSASTFSIAFTRHVGLPPARYAREQMTAGVT